MRITLDSVKQLVGHAAFLRAQKYASGSKVRSLAFDSVKDTLTAAVVGTQVTPYQVKVVFSAQRDLYRVVQNSCTCTVGFACKHVGAALIIFGQRLHSGTTGTANPGWQDDLGAVARVAERALTVADDNLPNLGLFLQPHVATKTNLAQWHMRQSSEPLQLRVRPTSQTASGSWSKNGMNWDDLEKGAFRRQWAEPQREALHDLATSFRETAYGTTAWIELAAKNTSTLWRHLVEARDAGVILWAHPDSKQRVTMHDVPARLAMHIDKDDQNISLRPRVSIGEYVFEGHNTILVGSPAHVILAWLPLPDGSFEYHLARLLPAAESSMSKLVQRRKPVVVPVRDIDEFQRLFLPALRKKIDVVSTDLDFEVEDPADPKLQVELWHTGPGELQVNLRWVYFYTVSEGVLEEVLVPFDAEVPTWFARHLEVEADIADAVAEYLCSVGVLNSPVELTQLALGERPLSGRLALDMSAVFAPHLGEWPEVRVEQNNSDRVYRAAETLPQVSLETSESTHRDWFDLHVNVTIDGEVVPLAELITAMSQQNSVMILASGTYFDTNVPELQKLRDLIHEARSMQDSHGPELRVSRYQFSLLEDLAALEIVNAQSESWQKTVLTLQGAEVNRDLAVPDSINATLRPYQVDGFRWLAFLRASGLGGVLADDMGLGKTLQIITMMAHSEAKRPYLVVCPTSVIGNWVTECRKFAPHLRVTSVDETSKRRVGSLRRDHGDFDIIVTSYTIFRLDFDEFGGFPWEGVIFDEAQFLKNSRTKVYECAKLVEAHFKIAATGTPMENRLAELWSLFSVVSPGLYPQRRQFDDAVAKPIERDGDSAVLDQLRRRIKPFMLRRTKEDVVKDLPPKQEQVLELELEPGHRRVYDMLLNRERQKILGLIDDLPRNQIQIFRALTLLRQAALDVSLVDPQHASVPSTKLDFLRETLEEIIAENHRVIVFSQFTGFLGKVRTMLDREGIGYSYLDGSTRKRGEVIDGFKAGDTPVFLISLKAGGFGLNLTEADYCILLDPWWNPAAEEQAVDRVHRIGQTKNVMVYRLVATNTIEEKVMALKAQKSALFDSVLEGGFAQAASLTADEIRELLA